MIMGPGGGAIADAIGATTSLQTLDLSFNFVCGGAGHRNDDSRNPNLKSTRSPGKDLTGLGIPEIALYEDYADKWRQMFQSNKSLIHVDLSHNRIKAADCKIIAEGLQQNHTILGLHF